MLRALAREHFIPVVTRRMAPIDPFIIEIMFLIERLVAYCQTGNIRLLPRQLFTELYIIPSIRSGGIPIFSVLIDPLPTKERLFLDNHCPVFRTHVWPRSISSNRVISGSYSPHMYYYNQAAFAVRLTLYL
jgi:hypothetical protein